MPSHGKHTQPPAFKAKFIATPWDGSQCLGHRTSDCAGAPCLKRKAEFLFQP